jgi:RNA polymerase sigma factor (TIGR02999 family)
MKGSLAGLPWIKHCRLGHWEILAGAPMPAKLRTVEDNTREQAVAIPADPGVPAAVRLLADQLLPLFYADLKRLAHRERVRVGAGATLQTTALAHETYLKMRSSSGWNDDTHFLRAAALAMRHALVNHANARRTAKRGRGVDNLPLTNDIEPAAENDELVLALHDALARLAAQSQRLSQVVECRFFAGYDEAATARALDISERTVRRDWVLAKAWLERELSAADR